MAVDRRPRLAPIFTRSRSQRLNAKLSRLRTEIITDILGYLPLVDLWRAAATSRALNAAAWRAGLYIHRHIEWFDPYGCAADFALLREIVQHILDNGLRLGFSLSSVRSEGFTWDAYHKSTSFVSELFSIVTAALPVLVYLRLDVRDCDDNIGPILSDALRHPAPYLKQLRLTCPPRSLPSTFPTDIFSGVAPHLHGVALSDLSLGPDAIPAFSRVESADLDCSSVYPTISLARQFPRLRLLRLACSSNKGAPASFKLDGTALHKLIIEDIYDYPLTAAVERSIRLFDIPAVEYVVRHVAWPEPLWQQKDDGALNIRLTNIDSDFMTMTIVPEHRRWIRTYRLREWDPKERLCPIKRMPGLHERVTYLRMDNIQLIGLLGCKYLALDALRRMQIDLPSEGRHREMLWPPDSGWQHKFVFDTSFDDSQRSARTFADAKDSYANIICCNLQTLTLFALDEPMRVQSQEVAFLGRALAQTTRPKEQRATLDLVGVELKHPAALKLLGLTFASVKKYEFAGRNSSADYDAGLWNEDA